MQQYRVITCYNVKVREVYCGIVPYPILINNFIIE